MNLGRAKQVILWLGVGFVWPLATRGACLNVPRLKDLMTLLTAVIRDVSWGWSAVALTAAERKGGMLWSSSLYVKKNLTSIFVLPPNLNQQNIGYVFPWQPAVFFLPSQTCSAICSNCISIKHHHVDGEQLRLKSRFLFLKGSGEFGLNTNYNHTYFEGYSAGLIDSPKSMSFSCDPQCMCTCRENGCKAATSFSSSNLKNWKSCPFSKLKRWVDILTSWYPTKSWNILIISHTYHTYRFDLRSSG